VRPSTLSIQIPLPAVRTVLAGLIGVEVVLVALHLVGLAADSTLLKLSSEDNIPTWFSSAQFAVAGLACWIASQDANRARTAWLALAFVMTAFSADEIARFHERFETRAGAEIAIFVIEPLLAALVVWLIWSARRHLTRQAGYLLVAAAGAIAASQLMASAEEKLDPTGVVRELLAVPAEFLEMLAGTLVLAAAIAYLGSRQSSKNA
jgi:hypothetical protein